MSDARRHAGGGGDALQVREGGEGCACGGERFLRWRGSIAAEAEPQFDVAMVGEGQLAARAACLQQAGENAW